MNQIEWYGLYSESWQGEIVPEAFSHPAKFSRAMIRQVYQHMIDMGYIKAGDRIVDPFGGVGLGAFDAMKHGLHWHGCELEPRFVELGNQNLELWQSRYAGWFANWGTAVLRQGDSRQLAQVIGAGDGCVSSPPFLETNTVLGGDKYGASQVIQNSERQWVREWVAGKREKINPSYGQTPGQLGSMPPGDFDAVVSSSPYGDAVQAGDGPGARWDEATHPNNHDKVSSAAEYGRTPGQLGNMRMDAAVSSPPFEEVYAGSKKAAKFTVRPDGKPFGAGASMLEDSYGQTPGNIGNDSGATFWTAARDIVQQVHEVLKPGGYAAWVCGDFVRKGERVYFGQQWLDLCAAVGFEPVEWITCWKTEYRGTQLDIFGGENHKQVDRVSFFRRLANEKNPDAAILNEDVIIVRKSE